MRYRIYVFIMACVSALAGIVLYGWLHNWIIIAYQPCHESMIEYNPVQTEQVCITYCVPPHGEYKYEERTIVYSGYCQERAKRILQQWVSVLDEARVLDNPCSIQSVALSPTGNILYVSYDHAPFNTYDAAYMKLHMIETMLHTLRDNDVAAESVHLLVQHQLIHDVHLDFTRPWPCTGFTEAYTLDDNATEVASADAKTFTLMLDPAGDARSPGRVVSTTYERGIALQACQYIKNRIEHIDSTIRVMITRSPGEDTEPLQNAAFTNRIAADVCIGLHVYAVPCGPPRAYVYHFLYHPETDFWHTRSSHLQLFAYNYAHIPYVDQSRYCAHALRQAMDSHLHAYVAVGPVVGMPFKPLIGMHVPAIAVEVGLQHEDDWRAYLDGWVVSIYDMIEAYRS